MAINGIIHYSIRTVDLKASEKFYTEVMGLTVGPHRERTVSSLELHQVFLDDRSQIAIELNYPAVEST